LHIASANHAGIIVCTRDHDVARQARRIHAAISAYNSLDGLLIRVYRPGRQRRKPDYVTSGSVRATVSVSRDGQSSSLSQGYG
jgi:hypothetical protein